ncbi:20927_t:CDS:1, partial [Racocetra persica]
KRIDLQEIKKRFSKKVINDSMDNKISDNTKILVSQPIDLVAITENY